MTAPIRLAAALACALPLAANAQERPNTMIVLDGSGSMWGQIDGVNKIVIAREVLGTILDDFPAEENLGLTVYGHRERGDCADIETMVPSGPGTVGAIRAAAEGINPRGKTPMTDAIVAAAEALRFTEERATVILVSDGVETCNPDPCAAARALEEAGIDFTAHVVGFDVTDPEALSQMQCLADETGGTFTTAADAAELSEALAQVTVAEPEPIVTTVTLSARLDGEAGPLVEGPVFWTLGGANGDVQGNPIELELETGSYTVEAYWAAAEVPVDRQFIATEEPREVALVFEAPAPRATVTAPDTAIGGTTIEIAWTGPAQPDDYIGIGPADGTGADQWRNWVYATEPRGTAELLVPVTGGDYVIRYFLRDGREPIAEHRVAVTQPSAALIAPGDAPAGTTIEVDWSGPDYADDYLGIGRVGATGADQWRNWVYTRDGAPASLLVPPEPGDYLIRYYARQGRVVIAETPIQVTAQAATLTAPAEAPAGTEIEIAWTGPDLVDDYIGIGPVGATGAKQWEKWVYTADGQPARLRMPGEAGDYVLTYFVQQDRTPLASVPITVTAQGATVTAPSEAVAGSTIEVAWTGPSQPDDYLGIGLADATGAKQWENYAYVESGSPTRVTLPTEPGDYLVQYFLNQDRTAIASTPITLTPAEASIAAPASAPAGSTIEVSWTGPDYPDDYLGIGRVDASGSSRWQNWAYTADGATLSLLVPPEPGDYEITYYITQDRKAVTSVPITVEPVAATVTAPASASRGTEIAVAWTGPAYADDYVAVGRADATGSARWQAWRYVADGNPVTIPLPDEPGGYVVRYFMQQGRTELAATPLRID